MYNCLDIYIVRNGYHSVCTGSLFFMLHLKGKVGLGRFLKGHKEGQNMENHYPFVILSQQEI